MISQHPNRVAPREIDAEVYKWRHLIEVRLFSRTVAIGARTNGAAMTTVLRLTLLQTQGVQAHRPAILQDSSFSAMIYIAAAVINSR